MPSGAAASISSASISITRPSSQAKLGVGRQHVDEVPRHVAAWDGHASLPGHWPRLSSLMMVMLGLASI